MTRGQKKIGKDLRASRRNAAYARAVKAARWRPNAQARFWAKVRKTRTCWLWTGATDGHGYGVFHIGERNDVVRATHFAYEGLIPDGSYVCHRCDNPGCVRPSHLFIGTQLDNMRDASRKGRFPSRKGIPRGLAGTARRKRENGG